MALHLLCFNIGLLFAYIAVNLKLADIEISWPLGWCSQQPMLVEENHTQLIKQQGLPTRVRVKETLSEIHSDTEEPKVNNGKSYLWYNDACATFALYKL